MLIGIQIKLFGRGVEHLLCWRYKNSLPLADQIYSRTEYMNKMAGGVGVAFMMIKLILEPRSNDIDDTLNMLQGIENS